MSEDGALVVKHSLESDRYIYDPEKLQKQGLKQDMNTVSSISEVYQTIFLMGKKPVSLKIWQQRKIDLLLANCSNVQQENDLQSK